MHQDSVVEPTCGLGGFLFPSLDTFPHIERGIALDISPLYISAVRAKLRDRADTDRVSVLEADFFQSDWGRLLADIPQPILVIGNPPWVTSAHIGMLGGSNLPIKNNFQNHSGLDAKMGKSNFDICESMLVQILDWLNGRDGCLAMLCKTAVARKLLTHSWKANISLKRSSIYKINALKYFGAAVDACFFVCQLKAGMYNYDCSIYSSLEQKEPGASIGYRDNQLIAKIPQYERWKHLQGLERYRWRSGIKHDCSRVMEFVREHDLHRNGFGQQVKLEETFLYPMLKTSEVAKQDVQPTRYMLVTQASIGEDTRKIKDIAPSTWAYLEANCHLLNARGSSIYKNRPPFSIFGVGDYSFAPWKVAISGFYKRLSFRLVGPHQGKPTILDDASYFIACHSETEARLVLHLLNSTPAQAFLESIVFWDAKRPITVNLLRRLDLLEIARECGLDRDLERHLQAKDGILHRRKRSSNAYADEGQLELM